MPISQIKDVKLHFKQSFLQASDKQQKISDNFTKASYRKFDKRYKNQSILISLNHMTNRNSCVKMGFAITSLKYGRNLLNLLTHKRS